jgi:hypothetical protein
MRLVGSTRRDLPPLFSRGHGPQLAQALGIPQRTLSFYEREAGEILAELAPPMVRALGFSVVELLGETVKKRRAGAEPTDRMSRLFEAVSKLPRSQQEKLAAVIEVFVNLHSERET